ncbi:MAG: hypothetical protein ACD_15C00108G0005 [uncultured bacterium]|nr:MAG: hypothetical protein ACD_15C00108G0005 [uncultured bacterium]HCU70895.1 hypothetical protein [Candidatus Moranbacteria bacterium]
MHFKEALLTKKDLTLGTLAGLLIGLLFLPVLNAGKPDLFLKINIFIIPFFLIGTPLGLLLANAISKKIAVIWQIAKFGVTGILNALVDLGSLALITWLARNSFAINSEDVIVSIIPIITFYSLYKAISFIIANINSYYWNKFWTFQKDGARRKSNFLQFFIVSVVGFAINVIAASVTFKIFAISPAITSDQAGLIGAIAGSIIGLVWNFIGYKFIVFKK